MTRGRYDKASKIAKKAHKEGTTLIEAGGPKGLNFFTEAQFKEWVQPTDDRTHSLSALPSRADTWPAPPVPRGRWVKPEEMIGPKPRVGEVGGGAKRRKV